MLVPVDPPIVGVDPGETIGVAVLSGPPLAWELHQLKWMDDLDMLKAVLDGAHTVVYETFVKFPKANLTGSRFIPVEVIGFLRSWTADQAMKVVGQPASIKQVLPNTEMTRLLGYKLVGGRHAVDAARHVLYYLVTEALRDPTSVPSSRCTFSIDPSGSPLVRRGRARQDSPSS